MTFRAAMVVMVLMTLAPIAAAAPSADEERWLDALHQAIIEDLAAGRPLVIQVHVPLCDNGTLDCGNRRLGDGDNPATNLYWSTGEGFVGWFGRRRSGWTQVLDGDGSSVGARDVLDVRVWTRRVRTSKAWRAQGAPAQIPVYVVVQAWRGEAIDRALAAYFGDLYGGGARTVRVAGGAIEAGGAARVVAYVGHNRLMDVAAPDWAALDRRGDVRVRGTIAIACHTAAYMEDDVPAPARVPLLFTRDFLMASAPSLEGAVLALAQGGRYAEIRRGATTGYAAGQRTPVDRVRGLFSNPADRRWRR